MNRDVDSAANDVRDRVSRVLSALPEEADPPEIVKADASADPVMFLNFNADTMSVLELTDYAERNIVDRLSTVPGVARVAIGGGRRYAMRIWIDRQALAARQLTVADIERRAAPRERPAARGPPRVAHARVLAAHGRRARHAKQDFRELVIGRGAGRPSRAPRRSRRRAARRGERALASRARDGSAGVGIAGRSAVEGEHARHRARRARGDRAHAGRRCRRACRSSSTSTTRSPIEAALHEVLIALALAFVSVLVVIYAFLGSLRATLIPAVTIPVSIIASFTVMYALGYSINVLTLLGLVLAIGLVVDDAIVVLENMHPPRASWASRRWSRP